MRIEIVGPAIRKMESSVLQILTDVHLDPPDPGKPELNIEK
jgi:hypothetical protein